MCLSSTRWLWSNSDWRKQSDISMPDMHYQQTLWLLKVLKREFYAQWVSHPRWNATFCKMKCCKHANYFLDHSLSLFVSLSFSLCNFSFSAHLLLKTFRISQYCVLLCYHPRSYLSVQMRKKAYCSACAVVIIFRCLCLSGIYV